MYHMRHAVKSKPLGLETACVGTCVDWKPPCISLPFAFLLFQLCIEYFALQDLLSSTHVSSAAKQFLCSRDVKSWIVASGCFMFG